LYRAIGGSFISAAVVTHSSFSCLVIQVARFVCVVLGWEGVQAAVGGCAEADKLAEPEQPTSSSLLHMVSREIGREGGREGGKEGEVRMSIV